MNNFLDLPEKSNSFYAGFYRPQNLHPDLMFVFGSNLQGIHGLGTAKMARMLMGAKLGVGVGVSGNTYAIPTKGMLGSDKKFPVLSLDEIKKYVDDFVEYTKTSGKYFYVTKVGTGLAGYSDFDIAPMFAEAKNCWFSVDWEPYILY